MTTTLTIRLPLSLARELKEKARAAKTTPTAVLRDAASAFVRRSFYPSGETPIQARIRARSGTWDGYCSGEELLRKTRP